VDVPQNPSRSDFLCGSTLVGIRLLARKNPVGKNCQRQLAGIVEVPLAVSVWARLVAYILRQATECRLRPHPGMEEAKQVAAVCVLAETVGDIVRKSSECRCRPLVSLPAFAMRKHAAGCWQQAYLILGWEIRCKAENEVSGETRTRGLGMILLNKMIF
jgi:hypothetical protein